MELQEILFNILTADIQVEIYNQNGQRIFSGEREDALEQYGQTKVVCWRIDGKNFRAEILGREIGKGQGNG